MAAITQPFRIEVSWAHVQNLALINLFHFYIVMEISTIREHEGDTQVKDLVHPDRLYTSIKRAIPSVGGLIIEMTAS